MSNIVLQWDDAEQSIILADFVAKWTWDDFHEALTRAYEMAASVPHRVDIIANSRVSVPMPSGSAFSHLSRVSKLQPENVKVIAIVTQNSFIRTVNEVLFRINRKAAESGAIARTVEEAREIIAARRAAEAKTASKSS